MRMTITASTPFFSPLPTGVFPITTSWQGKRSNVAIRSFRTGISFSQGPLFFSVKSAESRLGELHNFKVVPSDVLTAEKASPVLRTEKEAAKAILTLFLQKQGLSNADAAKTITKSDYFIYHLVSRVRTIDKTWYLEGGELATFTDEIKDALFLYLESLHEEHGDLLVDVVENFPNPPEKGPILQASLTNLPLDSKKLKAMARVSEIGTSGQLPPHILYLIEIGMDMYQIKEMARRYPPFAYCSLDGKIKPLVQLLLDLGVPPSNIPTILQRSPQLCSISLSENIIPTMAQLEELGLDKSQWAKVINQCPALFTFSKHKVKATVDYLCELGLSGKSIGKVITRFPKIMCCSIDDNLRPTAEYFRSMGVNLTSLFRRFPQIFGLSIENNLKPVTEFFLDKGFTIDDIGIMASKHAAFYTVSLKANLIPKWDFFLTMDYPRSELVKFPTYFGFSLEGRIKLRYEQVRESGVKMGLNEMLSKSHPEFERTLTRRKKMLNAQIQEL